MTLQERRLKIALQYLLHAVDTMYPGANHSAIDNAKVILECSTYVDFEPEECGSSVDDSGKPIADVYVNGVWQPDLVAVNKKECVLSTEPAE